MNTDRIASKPDCSDELNAAADYLRRAVEGQLEDSEYPQAIECAEELTKIAADLRYATNTRIHSLETALRGLLAASCDVLNDRKKQGIIDIRLTEAVHVADDLLTTD